MKSYIIKAISLISLGLIFSGNANAQQKKVQQKNNLSEGNYINAVGIRFGTTTGLTFKHRFTPENAVELILGTHPHAFGITGLYERYVLTNVEGLNLYFGGGAHISRGYRSTWGYTYNESKNQYYYYERNYNYGPIVGVDAIGGIEYRLQNVPVAFSFDLKPYAEFYRAYRPAYRWDPGLGIKFTF